MKTSGDIGKLREIYLGNSKGKVVPVLKQLSITP
jgi:hypothetical protein